MQEGVPQLQGAAGEGLAGLGDVEGGVRGEVSAGLGGHGAGEGLSGFGDVGKGAVGKRPAGLGDPQRGAARGVRGEIVREGVAVPGEEAGGAAVLAGLAGLGKAWGGAGREGLAGLERVQRAVGEELAGPGDGRSAAVRDGLAGLRRGREPRHQPRPSRSPLIGHSATPARFRLVGCGATSRAAAGRSLARVLVVPVVPARCTLFPAPELPRAKHQVRGAHSHLPAASRPCPSILILILLTCIPAALPQPPAQRRRSCCRAGHGAGAWSRWGPCCGPGGVRRAPARGTAAPH